MIYLLSLTLFLLPLLGPVQMGPFLSIPILSRAKEFFTILFIVITLFFPCGGHREKNKVDNAICVLMVFLVISTFSIPPINLQYGHENLGGFWVWRGLAWCFAYFIAYQRLSSIVLVREEHKNMIAKAISWSAVISAGYAYLQAFGLDQWQFTRSYHEIGDPSAPEISAMMGNATHLGVWLVMTWPFVILFLRRKWSVFIFGAIILCKSDVALAGAFIVLILLFCLQLRSILWVKVSGGIILLLIALMWGFWSEIRPKIHDNGRFAVWQQTFDDWRGPCVKMPITPGMSDAQIREVEYLNKRTYSLTGRGVGSFPFIFGPKFGSPFESAHNEWLESLYSIGLIGFGLLAWIVCLVLRGALCVARDDVFIRAAYASFVFSVIAVFFNPSMHIEPLRFYLFAVFVLLVNPSIASRVTSNPIDQQAMTNNETQNSENTPK